MDDTLLNKIIDIIQTYCNACRMVKWYNIIEKIRLYDKNIQIQEYIENYEFEPSINSLKAFQSIVFYLYETEPDFDYLGIVLDKKNKYNKDAFYQMGFISLLGKPQKYNLCTVDIIQDQIKLNGINGALNISFNDRNESIKNRIMNFEFREYVDIICSAVKQFIFEYYRYELNKKS